MRQPMFAHLPLLMRTDAHIALRHRAAEQNKSCALIFRKVGIRVVMLHPAVNQASRAGKTATLMTDRGQGNATRCGRIPDVLILSALECTSPLRGFQSNPVDPSLGHLSFDSREQKHRQYKTAHNSSRSRSLKERLLRTGLHSTRVICAFALRVIEAPILAVRRRAGFSAAEVS